jgi:hypothetical protein
LSHCFLSLSIYLFCLAIVSSFAFCSAEHQREKQQVQEEAERGVAEQHLESLGPFNNEIWPWWSTEESPDIHC